MIIYLGSDHRGFHLKEVIKKILENYNYNVVDLGNSFYDPNDDYPDFIFPVAYQVADAPDANRGIVFGATGQGEAMAANKVKGIRAAVFYGGSEEIIRLSREHNNANILSLGADFLSDQEAQKAVLLWLSVNFSAEARHQRRLEKIIKKENNSTFDF
jgi:ribose 5-phosphate isomerase B